ncbi:MAG TPA: hypothetical protein VG270_10755 [Pseudolabrys sp.]|jgi:hypothetical protein|nr:hypothetical protein [Pseudolabrys sp.]
MLVRLARALYLLVVVAMIAFYAASATTSPPAQSTAPEIQGPFEWC